MWLLEWYKQYLEIKYDFRERRTVVIKDEKVCESCETLKRQLEIVNDEKRRLIDRILEKPTTEPQPIRNESPVPIMPRHVPWTIRQQILEKEDRITAAKLKAAPKPDVRESTEDLEKDLNLAEQARETGTAKET